MQERQLQRKIVHLEAELVMDGVNHAVFIENISEQGMYVVTSPSGVEPAFGAEKECEMKIRQDSGQSLDLSCRVIWFYKTPPHGITNSVGLRIVDPPQAYRDYVRGLE